MLKKVDDQQATIDDTGPPRKWFPTLVSVLTLLNIVISLGDNFVQGYQCQY